MWGLDWGNYAKLAEPFLAHAVVVSLEITLTVTAISVLLAYPLAAIIAFRVPPRLQRLALLLALLPFWTSYVVRSYSWLLVLSREKVVNQTLIWMGLIAEPITLANTRFATVLGFVHFFTMLLTLTICASLVQLPRNYARAAADLGASGWQTFWHVVLPLTLPGVMTGAFLTFVLCIGDYVTPQILGGNNELSLPQVIMLQLGRRGDFPFAAALSIMLMGLVGAGLSRLRTLAEAGPGMTRAIAWAYLALIYAFILLPVGVLVLFSFQTGGLPVPPFQKERTG